MTREELLTNKLNYLDDTKTLIKRALEYDGVTVGDELTFREYAELIKNMDTGSVLLFETEADMINYENPKEGVLAIVYKSDNVGPYSPYDYYLYYNKFRYCGFPDIVKLEYKQTSNDRMWVSGYASSTSNIVLTPTSFSLSFIDVTTNVNINIFYISEDGITYTKVNTSTPNPVDFGYHVGLHFSGSPHVYSAISSFFKVEMGSFIGIFKCIDGVFVPVTTHASLVSPDQILTDYSAYGRSDLIIGDGSYISNIETNEYIAKYLPNITNYTQQHSVIQAGDSASSMEFVQRKQIAIDDAFTNTHPVDQCVVQASELEDIKVQFTGNERTIVQNYLNAGNKLNYAFFIGDVAYRLYLGYNYSTIQQTNSEGEVFTVPYQVTSVYAFIVNLEDLSIYRTFTNTDTWNFTENGFGNVLTYEYSIKSDCLVILTDKNGWGFTNAAYIGLTTIKPNGSRTTKYFNMTYSDDYSFKCVQNTSYDYVQDCYYLAYRTFQSRSQGGNGSTKRIVKLTPNGTLTSIYTSSEDMKYISSLWTTYFKNIDSLICYTTTSKGTVLRNLATGNEITLYGSTFSSSSYWGLDEENIYISHKLNQNDTYYNICRINKATLSVEVIPDTQSSSRLSNVFYTYNRDLCIFLNNKIISLQGEFLANFIKTLMTNPSISGIDRINEFMYKASFMDYQLVLSVDSITAKVPRYRYFVYKKITKFPTEWNICIMASSITSTAKNNDGNVLKMYQSLPLTDIYVGDPNTESEIIEANNIINDVLGQ